MARARPHSAYSASLFTPTQIENMVGEIIERVKNKGQPPPPEAQRAKMEALGLSDFQLAFYTRALPVLLQKLDLLPPE